MELEFHEAKRGYNKREVDTYIDTLRGEYDHIARVCNQMQERIHRLEEDQEDISRVMITAQSIANETKQEAQEKAQQIMAQAQTCARKLIEESTSKAGQIARQAMQTQKGIQTELQQSTSCYWQS